MTQPELDFWKKCSNCKKPLAFGAPYQACSVSTCNHPRRGLYFCSVSCWSAHVPVVRHRDAYALEKMAPSRDEFLKSEEFLNQSAVVTPQKVFMNASDGAGSKGSAGVAVDDKEILVVVSKLKAYIKDSADMNTAGEVMELLSVRLRRICDAAVAKARADGRKTVMNRDFV